MSVAPSELSATAARLAEAAAILLVAASVRTLDDTVDEPERATAAGVSYVGLLLALAAALAAEKAVPLFLACYAYGMTGHLSRRLPSGLTGLSESLLVVLLGAWRFGVPLMLAALSVIAFIQSLDDVIDFPTDLARGVTTWATRVGRVEILLFGLIAWCVALKLNAFQAVVAPVAAWLVTALRDANSSRQEDSS